MRWAKILTAAWDTYFLASQFSNLLDVVITPVVVFRWYCNVVQAYELGQPRDSADTPLGFQSPLL